MTAVLQTNVGMNEQVNYPPPHPTAPVQQPTPGAIQQLRVATGQFEHAYRNRQEVAQHLLAEARQIEAEVAKSDGHVEKIQGSTPEQQEREADYKTYRAAFAALKWVAALGTAAGFTFYLGRQSGK